MEEGAAFWNSFLRGVGTEPLAPRETLQGASGLNHPIVALGSDENLHRLVIVSGDPDARTAALAQADIQNRLPDQQVIFCRPIFVNFAQVAEVFVKGTGLVTLSPSDFQRFTALREEARNKFVAKKLKPLFEGIPSLFRGFAHANGNWTSAIQD
jgi:hypothetical protein